MENCNHYLGYLHSYEGIEEIYSKSELPYNQWIGFLDKRKNWGHLFKYCPECGEEFNRIWMLKEIKINYKNLCKK